METGLISSFKDGLFRSLASPEAELMETARLLDGGWNAEYIESLASPEAELMETLYNPPYIGNR